MERKKQAPSLPYEVRDPKLPVINARDVGNAAEQRRCGAPLPTDLPSSAAQQEGGAL